MEPAAKPGLLRFGAFELDAATGELRRNGRRVALTGPQSVFLTLLAANAGRIVSREEIQKALWGDEFAQSFDDRINFFVKKLRFELGDDPETPRYVRTVRGRGYEFIAPVEHVSQSPYKITPTAETPATQLEPVTLTTGPEEFAGHRPRLRRSQTAATALLGVAVLGAALLVYGMMRPAPFPRISAFTQLTNDGRPKGGRLVTDGTMVYFTEQSSHGWQIYRVSVTGGEATPISGAFRTPEIVGLDRGRSELLVLEHLEPEKLGPVWASPTSGGQPRRIGEITAGSAAYSPDGSSFAYSIGGGLYLCKADGSERRRIATAGGKIGLLSWSPDQRLLRFEVVSPKGDTGRIWEVRADGSDFRPFLEGWHTSENQIPCEWTPSDRFFLYLSGGEQYIDLWARPERGGIFHSWFKQPAQLTFGPEGILGCALSSHGKNLFIQSSLERNEFLRYDSQRKQFVNYLPSVSADEADFSKDGMWVAYADTRGTLLKRRMDGSQPIQLSFLPMRVEFPRWSPDGRTIAFMARNSAGDTWRVYVMPAEGGEPRPLDPRAVQQGAPTWSPDGTIVAFGDLLGIGDVRSTQTKIHLFDFRTNKTSELPGSEGLWTARWSPDGTQIAALTSDSRTIMVYDFRSNAWRRLAAGGFIKDLKWSSNSAMIYFSGELPPDGPAITCVRVRDGKALRVIKLLAVGATTGWIGLTPDGSPLISRRIGTSEIYSAEWREP